MNVRPWLDRFSPALLVGFILFLGFSIYAYAVNRDLLSKLSTGSEQMSALRREETGLKKLVELQNEFLGKKLPSTSMLEKQSQFDLRDSVRGHKLTMMVFIVGGCPTCFEDEAEIWDKLNQEIRSIGGFGVCINVSLRKEVITEFRRGRLVHFPILNDQGELSGFLKKMRDFQVVAFVLDSDLIIRRIHVSKSQDPSRTAQFGEVIRSYATNN